MIRGLITLWLFLFVVPAFGQQQSRIYQLNFGRNKHELSAQNTKILSSICDTLANEKGYLIYINGHTDSDADQTYNQLLSLKRSVAVKEFLLGRGIEESAIQVRAEGEEQPLVANTTPLAKARNRRVEIIVLFPQQPAEKVAEPKNDISLPGCNGDTIVILDGGFVLTLSKCDWIQNQQCLRVERRFTYKFYTKESWLRKHIGLKNYKKVISYEPHYEFYVVSCRDSCFQHRIKLYIPHYIAPGLKTSTRYSQRRNDRNQTSGLVFKNAKLGDSAYYTAEIFCPGLLECGTDNRCTHLVDLYARGNTSILSYSYYVRGTSMRFDSLVEATPVSPVRLTDNYNHTFFHTLTILRNGDTTKLANIPIDLFSHGHRKIKTRGAKWDKSYFLFIPFRKKYTCGHYKKYKLKARDIERLKNFEISELKLQR